MGRWMNDLLNMFDDLERQSTPKTRDTIVRAPFAYPGSKSKSIDKILPHLPYTSRYVEPFGGSAAILLARHKSSLEVFNDRYAGVVSFYICIRSKAKLDSLIEWIENTIHSREDFVWCKSTWKDIEDDVERAARWYYMTMYSFGRLGRNFGRATSSKAGLVSIRDKLKLFPDLHQRFKNVQVENQDWYQCMVDYDHEDTVFYIDPPYVDADSGIYTNKMSKDDHRRLLEVIFSLKGFCAVSGYSNPLYDSKDWDEKFEWSAFVSIKSMAYADGNYKENLEGQETRGHNTEVLWIKESR